MDAYEPFITRWTDTSRPRRALASDNRGQFDREIAGRIAGEGGYGGAGYGLKWNQDTIVRLGVVGILPEVDGSGGATARSGGGFCC